MTGTHYSRGRAKEYYQKDKLEKLGYLVVRSAGSHSPFDLIAIDKVGFVKFIQCKSKISKPARARLLKEYDWLNKLFLCSFEIIGGKK